MFEVVFLTPITHLNAPGNPTGIHIRIHIGIHTDILALPPAPPPPSAPNPSTGTRSCQRGAHAAARAGERRKPDTPTHPTHGAPTRRPRGGTGGNAVKTRHAHPAHGAPTRRPQPATNPPPGETPAILPQIRITTNEHPLCYHDLAITQATDVGQSSAVISHLQVTRSMLSDALGIPVDEMSTLKVATASPNRTHQDYGQLSQAKNQSQKLLSAPPS